jgi:hypothetical protein
LDGKLIVSVPAAASQLTAGKKTSYRTSEILKIKVQIFLQATEKWSNLRSTTYLVAPNYDWKMGQIFVAFSEL